MTNLSGKILDLSKKTLISIGKNNKPIYAIIAVAAANGIFKPLSSLTDKKEKPEARKYAALREFLTEVVAIPTYWSCGVGAAKLGEKLFKGNPEKEAIARANMMFLGVCVAAIFVIPAVCSLLIKGLDAGKKKGNVETKKLDVVSKTPEMPIYKPNVDIHFGNFVKPDINTFIHKGGLKI